MGQEYLDKPEWAIVSERLKATAQGNTGERRRGTWNTKNSVDPPVHELLILINGRSQTRPHLAGRKVDL